MSLNFPYKKFLIGYILVVLLLGLGVELFTTYCREWFLDVDYGRASGVYHILDTTCLDGKTIILGDSASRDGLDPRILGDDYYNLSLGASNAVEIYYELERMRFCHVPPKRVLIAIAPHHFMYDDGYWISAIRYGLITYSDMQEVRKYSSLLHDPLVYTQTRNFFSVSETSLDEVMKELHTAPFYFSSMRNALYSNRKKDYLDHFNNIVRNQGYYAMQDKPVFIDAPSPHPPTLPSLEGRVKYFSPTPLIDLYFNKLLSFFDEHGVEVICFNMPITEITKSHMTEQYAEAYKKYMLDTLAKHKNAHYAGEFFPIEDTKYFSDHTHLNAMGAYYWTNKISPTLKSEQ